MVRPNPLSRRKTVSIFYPGVARSLTPFPHFFSSKVIPTLLWSTSCSYPYECHSDPDWVQRVEPPLPIGHFVGRDFLYLYFEAGTQRSAIHVDPEPLTTICYGTSRLA